MLGEHYRYQQEALNAIINKDLANVAVSFPCGMGKSRLALAWLEYLFYKHACKGEDRSDLRLAIIVAPNGVHEQWVLGQIVEHYNAPCRSHIYRAGNKAKEVCASVMTGAMYGSELSVVSINVETFSRGATRDYLIEHLRYLKNEYWMDKEYAKVALILDEATFIKNNRALRTKGVMQLSKLVDYRMFLTASMYVRNLAPAYMCYEFLSPGEYRGKKSTLYRGKFWGYSYNDFMAIFGVQWQPRQDMSRVKAEVTSKLAKRIKDAYRYKCEQQQMTDEMARIAMTIAFRMERADVDWVLDNKEFVAVKNLELFRGKVDWCTFTADKALLDLPPKQYILINCEQDIELKKKCNTLKRVMEVEQGEKVLSVNHVVNLMRRLRMLANGIREYDIDDSDRARGEAFEGFDYFPKTRAILEKLRQITESGERAIVWADSPVYLEAIATAWFRVEKDNEDDHIIMTGQTGSKEKTAMIELITSADNTDKPRVLFLSPLVGAFGLNLQDYAHQLWALNSGFLERRYQGEERSHRIGQKSTVFIYDFVLRNTVEVGLRDLNVKGIDLNEKLNSMDNLQMSDILKSMEGRDKG